MSNRVVMGTWSAPRVTTMGHMQSRSMDMVNERDTTSRSMPSSLGYKFSGLSVPEVITVVRNRWNTGRIANSESDERVGGCAELGCGALGCGVANPPAIPTHRDMRAA